MFPLTNDKFLSFFPHEAQAIPHQIVHIVFQNPQNESVEYRGKTFDCN